MNPISASLTVRPGADKEHPGGKASTGVLVSAIIPVRDRPAELARALRSVVAQTLSSWEAIVVDDGSDVDLEDVCRRFGDERIRYHRLAAKQNANVARNEGLRLARGQYIAMLDSDDEWLASHLEAKLAALERGGWDGVFGSYVLDDGVDRREYLSRDFRPGEKMPDYLLSYGGAVTPTHVYKTECARVIGWDEELLRHQDYDFSIRFADRFVFRPSREVTCIVHAKRGERRTRHVASQIRFMGKHGAGIAPNLRFRYYAEHLAALEADGAPADQIDFFRHGKREALRAMSYSQFLSVSPWSGYRLARLIHKIRYAWLRATEGYRR